jgi:hypothetical protein
MGTKVLHRPTPLDTPCVEWTGSIQKNGYGYFYAVGTPQRQVLAHRAAAAAVLGWEALEGKVVLHRCDNPPCVRYDHLQVGTQVDNCKDMWAKGRGRNGTRRLTSDQVRRIRSERQSGRTLQSIADEFGVTSSNIHYIIANLTWKELI